MRAPDESRAKIEAANTDGESQPAAPSTSVHSRRKTRQRRRGALAIATEQLAARYDRATAGSRRRGTRGHEDALFAATGDPLVLEDRAAAERLYGLVAAKRPTAALRRIAADTWGDQLAGIADMALQFQRMRSWSTLRAAGEAVALAAERGTWIGLGAPVSFAHAVERVRKAAAASVRQAARRQPPAAWTGAMLFVRPAEGALVSLPAAPPRTRLPVDGDWVRDDHYWRRRLFHGDVVRCDPPEKNTQPSTT
jgi:hypothetical protein